MAEKIAVGSVDVTRFFYIVQDDGTPFTGLAFGDVTLFYARTLTAVASVTPVTLAALTTAHADGGFLEVGSGWYRIDFPDAAFAFGQPEVLLGGAVTAGTIIGQKISLSEDYLVVHRGFATAATAGTVTLAATAPTTEDIFRGYTARVIRGTGVGQSQPIASYSTGRVATLLNNWAITPDTTSLVDIVATPDLSGIVDAAVAAINANTDAFIGTVATPTNVGDAIDSSITSNLLPRMPGANHNRGQVVADGGNTGSTFRTDLSGVNDTWNDAWLRFTGGNIAGETKRISDYVASGGVISVEGAYTATPDAGSTFDIVNH